MTKVTGELISIDDSAYDGFKGMTIYGKTVQNLWVNPSGTSDGVTVTSNADGSVTLAGTTQSNNIWIGYKNRFVLRPGSTYTLSVDNAPQTGVRFYVESRDAEEVYTLIGLVISGRLSHTFTVPDDCVHCNFLLVIVEAGVTVSGTYRVMLNEGSEPEPWCPPGLNSVGELSVVTAGKNYFLRMSSNTIKGITVTANSDGSYTLNGTSSAPDAGVVAPVVSGIPKGHELTLSSYGYDDTAVKVQIYFKSIDGAMKYIDVFKTPKTFTIPEGATGIRARIAVNRANCTVNNVTVYPQLELGSTATDYEPPNVTTTPIDLQGHALNSLPDGTRDELTIDGTGAVTLTQRVGVATFDGSEDEIWGYQTYKLGMNNGAPGLESQLNNTNGRCDTLPIIGTLPSPSIFAYAGGWVDIQIDDVITDAESGKEWLAANHTTLLYPLATPQTIQLGKISLPKLRKKPLVNNVWINGRDVTTNFYLDTEIELTYRQWPGVRADGFKVSGKHNFWDFESCVASSDSGKPEKKFVTATVPYMSGFYDLSKIYGAIAYESRDVSYTFELLGDDMDDLQRKKTNLLDWLGLVHDEPIYDDTQQNYHYVGSFYEADWEEDETGESGTLTVTFRCQPFLIADRATEESLSVGTHTVVNNGQQVSVFAKANSGSATVKINGVIQAVTTTEQRLTAQLQPGENEVVVTSNSVTLRYYERHL